MEKQQEKIGIDIKLVTKITSHEDYTSKFFKEGELPERYRIIKIDEEKYGMADLKSKECEITFRNISKISNSYYLLEFENGNQVLMMLWCEDQKIFSEPFKEVIQIFKGLVIVKSCEGKRKLIMFKQKQFFRTASFFMSEWFCDEKINNTIVIALDGKSLILLKEGLTLAEKEYKHVRCNVNNIEVNNNFRIVIFEDESMAVVRIHDLEESEHFKKIEHIERYNSHPSKDYVEVTLNDDKKAVLRISDFKVSQNHDGIDYLSANYALVYDGEENNILRLSDFAEAQWPEKQES
jgi:hypothetical protein